MPDQSNGIAPKNIYFGFMKKKANENTGKISRSEALTRMGAVAAGVPFINGTLNSLVTPEPDRHTDKALKNPILAKAIAELEYLTPADKFIVQRRGNPVLTEIPMEKLASIGLTPGTWKMEIVADPDSNSEIGNPISIEKGNAFTWDDLMKMAETKSVRYLHALTCTNSPKLYGMGLWEGVPLREIFWKTLPKQNIRRIYFHGYHNNDEKQIFRASLPISKVLEEAPGELPVIVAYKLNGKPISHANGGPVRLFVPGYYSNRSIKWLQKITVTNSYHANDTYAEANNDVEGPVKTCARFIHTPVTARSGEDFAITGFAQVGSSGLGKVQYWIHPAGKLPGDDPYFTKGDWRDAIVLPPPPKWGSDLPDGKLPDVLQFDPETGRPFTWPVINTIVHWAVLAKADTAGEFEIRCRTIDANGIAQPMPRPFGRSGYNRIDVKNLIVH
ncbi:MAG TPA: molybdopterin-dependent oxidoreductase [Bacteroidales bacterium]|nr:molybdopterin-dependent oxidoreductase [Bacteroidales bacterium]